MDYYCYQFFRKNKRATVTFYKKESKVSRTGRSKQEIDQYFH